MTTEMKSKMMVGDRGVLTLSNSECFNAVIVLIRSANLYFEDRGFWPMPYRTDDPIAPYVRSVLKENIRAFEVGKLLVMGVENRIQQINHPRADKYHAVEVVHYLVEKQTPILEYRPEKNDWIETELTRAG